MKTLIVYSSQTGNTRKMAEAANEMFGETTELYPVHEAPDPDGYNLIVVCFWLQAGMPDPKSQAFLSTLDGINLFLVATHGAAPGSAHAMNAMTHAKKLSPSSTVLGMFNCQGEVNPKVLKKAREKDPQPPWIADAPAAAGHPDAQDVASLKKAIAATLPAFIG